MGEAYKIRARPGGCEAPYFAHSTSLSPRHVGCYTWNTLSANLQTELIRDCIGRLPATTLARKQVKKTGKGHGGFNSILHFILE